MQHAGPKDPLLPGCRARHRRLLPPFARRCSPRRTERPARLPMPAPVFWPGWAPHQYEPAVATRRLVRSG
eukprot:1383272-Lingulodinium_polyedra.AAC.1